MSDRRATCTPRQNAATDSFFILHPFPRAPPALGCNPLRRCLAAFFLHPSSFILHPSSFILFFVPTLLKLSCPDQVGLLARISGWVAAHGGNLITVHQFTD